MADGFTNYDDPAPHRRTANEDGQWFTPSVGLSYWFSTWNGIDADLSYTRGLYEETTKRLRQLRRPPALQPPPHPADRRLTASTTRSTARGTTPATPTPTGGQLQQDYLVYAPSVGVFHQFDPTLTGLDRRRLLLPAGEERQRPEGARSSAVRLNKLWDFQRWSVRLRTVERHRQPGLQRRPAGLRALRRWSSRSAATTSRASFFGDLASALPLFRLPQQRGRRKGLPLHAGRRAGVHHHALGDRPGRRTPSTNWTRSTAPRTTSRTVGYVTLTLSPDQPWRIFD